MFELTRVKSNRPVTKIFSKSGSGDLDVISNGEIYEATIKRTTVETIQQLGIELQSLNKNECLIYGVTDPEAKELLSDEIWQKRGRPQGYVTRSTENFNYPNSGVMFFDFDVAKDGSGPQTLEQVHQILIDAVPELSNVKMLAAPSTSSFIYDGEEQKHGLRGVHFYVLVTNAQDIPFVGELINQKLWAKGYGHYEIIKDGRTLEKAFFDKSAWQTNRVDFCSGAICNDGLEQRGVAPVILGEGADLLDIKMILSRGLTDEDKRLARAHKTLAESAKKELAKQVREQWISERKASIHAQNPSLNDGELNQRVKLVTEKDTLPPEWEITVKTRDEGEVVVTVEDAMKDPKKYHGAVCCDPVEPDYRGGASVAKLYLDGVPHIHSFAHGGTTYQLLEKPDYSEFADKQKPAQLFTTLNDAIKKLKAVDWQIDKMIKQGTLSLTHADAGEGKTYLAVEMGMCIATGIPLWGNFLVKQGNVLYVANEDRDGVTRRAAAWQFDKNGNAEVKSFYVCNAPLVFLTDPQAEDSIFQAVKWIEESGVIPTMVFIDTFVDALGEAKENEADSISKLFRIADEALVRRFGSSVMFIHHNSKGGDVRGSTAIRGKMDHIFAIKQYAPNKFEVSNQKNKHGTKNDNYKLNGRTVGFELPTGDMESNLVLDFDSTKPHPDGLDFVGQKIVSILEKNYGLNVKVQKAELREKLKKLGVAIDKGNLGRHLEPLKKLQFIQIETRTVELLKRETVVDFEIDTPSQKSSSLCLIETQCDDYFGSQAF